jgi:CheY-like chemotaxis protein
MVVVKMTIPYGPILIVEDVPNILELITITLRFKGYPVITATDGIEALEKIAQERPVLVISDILMPRMDGFSLAQVLRRDGATHEIPIIFLSATYSSPEDQRFAKSIGVVRFIEKPFDPEDLLLSVAEVLTGNPSENSVPMDAETFYMGYRERVESKLRQKNAQIARTERLLRTLSEDQREGFIALLESFIQERDEIQTELDRVNRQRQS